MHSKGGVLSGSKYTLAGLHEVKKKNTSVPTPNRITVGKLPKSSKETRSHRTADVCPRINRLTANLTQYVINT